MIVDHPWFECIISLAILVTCRSMDIPMGSWPELSSWELISQGELRDVGSGKSNVLGPS